MNKQIKLSYDPVVVIAEGASANSKKWINKEYDLSNLFARFQHRLRTSETQAQYFALKNSKDKAERDRAKQIKDRAGGFVGGMLDSTGLRQRKHVVSRQLLTWDFDSGVKPFMLPGVCCAIYSTHSHTAEHPRFRVIAPLSRAVAPDEYERLSRLYVWEVSEWLDMEPDEVFTDDTTHLPEHLQYWPSAPNDAEIVFDWQDGPPLDVDRIMDTDREPFYLKEHTAAAPITPGTEPGERDKVPVGERYKHLVRKAGQLVDRNPDASVDSLLSMLWVYAHEVCDGDIDGEDYAAFCDVYRPTFETFRARLLVDNYDFSEAVRIYKRLHPDEELPKKGSKTDWNAVKTEVETARIMGVPAAAEQDGSSEKAIAFGWGDEDDKTVVEHPERTQPPKTEGKNKENILSALRTVAEVEEEPIEWLIPFFLPLGAITAMGGDGGVGKTLTWCAITAAVSTGRECFLDKVAAESDFVPAEGRKPGKVIFFSSEDSVSKVLIKRLKKEEANLNMIRFMEPSNDLFSAIKFDSQELKAIVEAEKPALLIFDPLQSFIPEKVDMSRRNAMRAALNPLIGLAEENKCAVLIAMHTNKRMGGASGRNRLSDSSDIWDIARSVWLLGRDRAQLEPTFYLSQEKGNYGMCQLTALYNTEGGKINYLGTTDRHDFDFVQENERSRSASQGQGSEVRTACKDAIMNALEENGEMLVGELETYLIDAVSFSKTAVRKAKADLIEEGSIRVWSTGQRKSKQWHIAKKIL